MLTAAALLAACVSLPVATRQEPASDLVLTSDWPVGLRYSLELVKSREERKDGVVVKSGESTTPVDVELLAKDDEGYVCRWTLGRTRMTKGVGEKDAAMAERVLNAFEGLTLDMRLDATGSVQGFADDDGARKLIQQCVATLAKASPDGGAAAKQIEAAFGAMDPNVLGATMLREPTLMYVWCGSQFELGKKREYEDQLPNPFGGDPFPTRASIELVELRGAEAVIEWKQRADPERTAQIMLASLKAMARKMGKPEPKVDELPKLAFEDRARFVFDVSVGLPRSAEWSRTTSSDGTERVDGFRIVADFDSASGAKK
jgi:hypothetical protein